MSEPLNESSASESVPRETPAVAEELFGDRFPLALAYADALATTGAERGLIGPREIPRIWDRHLLNCVVLSELVPPEVELADVGSGAGLPGLPIAIARPDVTVYLVEPLLRRVTWLREVVNVLGLQNVEIIRSRANAAAESGQRFDVVTARAVAPLPGLLDLCLPLLKPGGELLAMKGEGAAQELDEAGDLLKRHGAVEWAVDVCGTDTLETPTTVVRVVAGTAPEPTSRPRPSGKRNGSSPSAGRRPVAPRRGKRR